MHRENLLSTIVYVLMVGIAVGLGLAVVGPAFGGKHDILGMDSTTFILLSLLISILINVILFEVGHVIGAKLGKYEVKKVNVLGFQFTKNEKGKTKINFPRYYDGLTGETAVAPKGENSNPQLFLVSPLVVFVIEVLLLLTAYLFIKEDNKDYLFIKYFLLILVTVGAMLFIYDYFPAKIDSTTDGFILTLANKKENVSSLNYLYSIKNSYVDLHKANGEEKINDITGQINSRIASELMFSDRKKASDIIERNLSEYKSLTTDTFYESACVKLSLMILENNKDEIKKCVDLLGPNGLYFLRHFYSAITIKASLLYFGLVEKSEIEIDSQIKKITPRLFSLDKRRYDEEIKNIKEIVKIIKEKDNSISIDF